MNHGDKHSYCSMYPDFICGTLKQPSKVDDSAQNYTRKLLLELRAEHDKNLDLYLRGYKGHGDHNQELEKYMRMILKFLNYPRQNSVPKYYINSIY